MLALLLFATACSREEPPAPAAPVVDQAVLNREKLFGDAARDPAIAWRPSGLGIRVITPGAGVAPTPMDRVRMHYTGRLKDGKVFDDTRQRGKPSDFSVNRLVIGLAAGLPALKPGGKAVLFIPPSLGYGGVRVGDIPPFSGLIFEVELLEVNPPEEPTK